MLNIGSHLSVSKGYEHMGKEALSIGANTFQFFSRNPRGGKAKELDEKDINGLRNYMKEHNFAKILAHAPYIINSCADRIDLREAAKMVILDDIKRMEYLPDNLYTFHPGCHVGQGVDKGIKLIGDVLNHVLYAEQTTIVLLELMSGKGSEVGSNFEEIREIINCVELSDKVGVCMDTCHVYSAGYDIVNDLDGVLHKFDDTIGLNKLKAIHLNDSLTPYASHKDRHARIGEGSLGFEAIVGIINHPKLKELPFYLETPNELSGYEEEIKMLREAYLS